MSDPALFFAAHGIVAVAHEKTQTPIAIRTVFPVPDEHGSLEFHCWWLNLRNGLKQSVTIRADQIENATDESLIEVVMDVCKCMKSDVGTELKIDRK